MKLNCAERRAIVLEIKAALADAEEHPDPSLITTDVGQCLNELFSSEESIHELSDSVRTSPIGEAYSRWTAHRIATGHTGSRFSNGHVNDPRTMNAPLIN